LLVLAALGVVACAAAQAATRPSKVQCAVAWNHGAAPVKAARLTSTRSVGCAIQFILANDQVIQAWGAWTRDTVGQWHSPSVPYNLPFGIHARNNTAVHRDGTVGFHG
jgi:hypothetical protein